MPPVNVPMPLPWGELALRLAIAILVGGLIGAEREYQDKAAGLRTLIFICLGAMLFSTFAIETSTGGDGRPIIAGIVTGVGFLGAGVIMREGGKVTGLTTAATIWLTAALGMGIGAGEYVLTAVAMPFILVVLWLFPRIEGYIDTFHAVHMYEVTCILNEDKIMQLERVIREGGLRLSNRHIRKVDCDMIVQWRVVGPPKRHETMMLRLMNDGSIKEFTG